MSNSARSDIRTFESGIWVLASYESDHIVAFLLFFVMRMATPPGLFERPIIFGHDFGSHC